MVYNYVLTFLGDEIGDVIADEPEISPEISPETAQPTTTSASSLSASEADEDDSRETLAQTTEGGMTTLETEKISVTDKTTTLKESGEDSDHDQVTRESTTEIISGEPVTSSTTIQAVTARVDVASFDDTPTTASPGTTDEEATDVSSATTEQDMSMPHEDGAMTVTDHSVSRVIDDSTTVTSFEETTTQLPSTEKEELTTPTPKGGTDLPGMLTDIISTISTLVANGLFGDDADKSELPDVTTQDQKEATATDVSEITTETTVDSSTTGKFESVSTFEPSTASGDIDETSTEKGESFKLSI